MRDCQRHGHVPRARIDIVKRQTADHLGGVFQRCLRTGSGDGRSVVDRRDVEIAVDGRAVIHTVVGRLKTEPANVGVGIFARVDIRDGAQRRLVVRDRVDPAERQRSRDAVKAAGDGTARHSGERQDVLTRHIIGIELHRDFLKCGTARIRDDGSGCDRRRRIVLGVRVRHGLDAGDDRRTVDARDVDGDRPGGRIGVDPSVRGSAVVLNLEGETGVGRLNHVRGRREGQQTAGDVGGTNGLADRDRGAIVLQCSCRRPCRDLHREQRIRSRAIVGIREAEVGARQGISNIFQCRHRTRCSHRCVVDTGDGETNRRRRGLVSPLPVFPKSLM